MHVTWPTAAATFATSRLSVTVAERRAARHSASIAFCVASFNRLVCLLWSLSQPLGVQKIGFDILRLWAESTGVSMADKGVCF